MAKVTVFIVFIYNLKLYFIKKIYFYFQAGYVTLQPVKISIMKGAFHSNDLLCRCH